MTPIIEMKNVNKRFGKTPVVTRFNLTVQPGEILGMLGPSGIGKSTILRMIAGLETPDSGHMHVDSSHIGYVFQEARLLPWDTALDNVILPLRAQGMDKKKATDRARLYLKRMRLFTFEKAYPHQLSGGMRQRVALARAFAINPDILLLDEPFTGLDKNLKKNMQHLLDTILEASQIAVIHVTHDQSELLGRTNRTIHLGPQPQEQCKTPYQNPINV